MDLALRSAPRNKKIVLITADHDMGIVSRWNGLIDILQNLAIGTVAGDQRIDQHHIGDWHLSEKGFGQVGHHIDVLFARLSFIIKLW